MPKGDHALILIPVLPHLTPTGPIDQSQTENVTPPILLEIHVLTPGPEVDLIPEVAQGFRGQVEVDRGVLLHSLDLVHGPETGQGQGADQTLDTAEKRM